MKNYVKQLLKKICAPLCNDALLPKSMKTGLSSTELDAPKTGDDKMKPNKINM